MKKMKLLTACCILATLGSTAQARDVIHRWCPPEEPQTAPAKQIELSADALFRFDKYAEKDMLPEGKARLDELSQSLSQDFVKVDGIVITGHTDYLGDQNYNLALGQQRADTVKAYLLKKGVQTPLSAHSAGESQPVVQCDATLPNQALKACLQPNRRVTLAIHGQVK